MPQLAVAAAMCLSLVGAVMGVFAFPSLLPLFQAEWNLSNAEAGWINGIYFAGYALAVAWLSSLADRIDAKRIFLLGAFLLSLSNLLYALLAEGFWTALAFQGLAGIGLAACYMPGLKALLDRYRGAKSARISAFYTASFSLGSALGYAGSGWAADHFGWRAAFLAASLAALSSFLLALAVLERRPAQPPPPGRLLDFRPVLRNKPAMAYILAYGAHCWELFGQRGWMVAFLSYAALASGGGSGWPSPTAVASLAALIAMVSSILGGEIAMKFNRRKVVAGFLLSAGALSLGIGFTADLSYGLVVMLCFAHAVLIQGDSAALTAGAVEMAEPGRRGATMALHSVVGFGAAFAAPVAMGVAIDLGGGAGSLGFGLGFAVLGLASLPGVYALIRLSSDGRTKI